MSQPQGKPGPTAQSVVADSLRSRILAGDPLPGTPLREEDLAEQYAVSRHTVRSALAVLAAERIVETVPYRGSRVTDLNDEQVTAMQDLRCALEAAAIRLLHNRYGGAWPTKVLAPIESALDDLSAAEVSGDFARITSSHVTVHARLVAASHSSRISEAYEGIASEMLLLTSRVGPHYPAGSLSEQHRNYLRDVQSGNPEVVWQHLNRSTELMRLDRGARAHTS